MQFSKRTGEWVVSTLVHEPAAATFADTQQDGEEQQLVAAQAVEAQCEYDKDFRHTVDHMLDIRLHV